MRKVLGEMHVSEWSILAVLLRLYISDEFLKTQSDLELTEAHINIKQACLNSLLNESSATFKGLFPNHEQLILMVMVFLIILMTTMMAMASQMLKKVKQCLRMGFGCRGVKGNEQAFQYDKKAPGHNTHKRQSKICAMGKNEK